VVAVPPPEEPPQAAVLARARQSAMSSASLRSSAGVLPGARRPCVPVAFVIPCYSSFVLFGFLNCRLALCGVAVLLVRVDALFGIAACL